MFLVDGYNAIRRVERLKTAEARAGLAGGRRALIATIVASGVLRSQRVVVVFDGSSEGRGSEISPHPDLAVRYSTPPSDADAAILSLLRGAPAGGSGEPATVVTADQELSFEARRLGALVVSPERWVGLRTAPRAKRRARRPPSSDKPQASASDVRYWLEVFGADTEDE